MLYYLDEITRFLPFPHLLLLPPPYTISLSTPVRVARPSTPPIASLRSAWPSTSPTPTRPGPRSQRKSSARRGEETVRKRSGCLWCATADPLLAGANKVLATAEVLLAASSSSSSSRSDFYALLGLPVSACGDCSSLFLYYCRLALLLRSPSSPPLPPRPSASSRSGDTDTAGDAGLVPGAVRGGAGGAEFLSLFDLRRLPAFGKLVTTLFQTTSRAPSDLGAVNLTSLNSSAVLVRSPTPFSPSSANSNTTILGLVTSLPYDVSVTPSSSSTASTSPRPRPAPPSASTSRGYSSRHMGSTSLRPCSSASGERGAAVPAEKGAAARGAIDSTAAEKVEEEEEDEKMKGKKEGKRRRRKNRVRNRVISPK
uniref:Uncharacterized protein n=1 Tax=Ananas comosus var. bracteatus TaxID=296719 RepID=A0A6V7PLC6_ANACO|nr:unnamed protein product [Ananas comosus var. bracteatus]